MAGYDERAPLKARLHWYKLTCAELALLTAMYEHCSDGSVVNASFNRLAAYAKLSRRQVIYLIYGREDREGDRGLLARGILTQLATGHAGKQRAATFRINQEALEIDPAMKPYLERGRQRGFPGMSTRKEVALPFEPISTEGVEEVKLVHQVHGASEQGALDLVNRVHSPSEQGALDSCIDSINPIQNQIHHADGAMKKLPAWLAIKEQLRGEMPPEEWELWVRPARLLRTIGSDRRTLLVAVPTSGAIMAAAAMRRELLRDVAARSQHTVLLTKYPDDWERDQAKQRFGLEAGKKR